MIMERVIFAGVLVLFVTTLSPVQAGGRKAIEACIESSEINADDFISLMKSDGPTENFKCWLSCVLKGSGLMSEDGTISTEGIATQFDPSALASLQACSIRAQSQSEVCQRAHVFLSCAVMVKPRDIIGFLIAE